MRKEGEGKEKLSLGARLARYTDVSLCMFSDFRVTVERIGTGKEKMLTAHGAGGILVLRRDRITLDYDTEVLDVRGPLLECMGYADGAIRICGDITRLAFGAPSEDENASD